MVMTVSAFDTAGRGRITQLINKSNQFNLTTRRYTEADIDQMIGQPRLITFQIRLADSFGDNGMISVVVARPLQESDWEIDTWLMSCRVLGRGVERAVLTELVDTVRQRAGLRLIGVYRPTDKNEVVADHYRKLGFAHQNTEPNGNTSWTLDVAGYVAPSLPIRVMQT
jgi:FkbH-like protein